MPGRRLRHKMTPPEDFEEKPDELADIAVDAAEMAEEAGSEHEEDEADGGDERTECTCTSCKQGENDFEKDLQPTQSVKIRWHRIRVCPTRGRKVKYGSECYFCWRARTKHYPKMSQTKLQKSLKMDDRRVAFEEKRRALVRGEAKWGRGAGAVGTVIKEKQRLYDKQYRTGHFYLLDDYIRLVKGPVFHTFSEKVRYINEVCKKKVIKDKRGSIGIRELKVPTGALYEFEEGIEDEKNFEEVIPFEDANDGEADRRLLGDF